MKLVGAFFRLVRWPNLLFMVLTQALFYYCILLPTFLQSGPVPTSNLLQYREFWILCAASVCIAAAGYIINDYFDLAIDRINKPGKMVIERVIKRRSTILWHWFFSALGLALSLYISIRLRNPIVVIANFICIGLLWFYSTTFKRKLLLGNVIVSLLTAWVILVLYACEFRFHRLVDNTYHILLARVYKYAILYASFAFIASLVREVIKDMEDMDGDGVEGCRTIPIVWGVPVAKVFVLTWAMILMGSILIVQFYVLQYRWWWSLAYTFLFILLPLAKLMLDLRKAKNTSDYHHLSSLIKWIMLAGIWSMLFFKLYRTWNG